MARILNIVLSEQIIRSYKLEESVACQYKVIEADDGQRLVHFSASGAGWRESSPKSIQSKQFDRAFLPRARTCNQDG